METPVREWEGGVSGIFYWVGWSVWLPSRLVYSLQFWLVVHQQPLSSQVFQWPTEAAASAAGGAVRPSGFLFFHSWNETRWQRQWQYQICGSERADSSQPTNTHTHILD